MLLTVQINYLYDTGINEYGGNGGMLPKEDKTELLAEIATHIPLHNIFPHNMTCCHNTLFAKTN